MGIEAGLTRFRLRVLRDMQLACTRPAVGSPPDTLVPKLKNLFGQDFVRSKVGINKSALQKLNILPEGTKDSACSFCFERISAKPGCF